MAKSGRGGKRGSQSTQGQPTVTQSQQLNNLIAAKKAAPNGTNDPGDYTDGGNAALIKFQGQDDDKTANFLASTDRNVDLNDPQYADGFTYYDIPLNKTLLRLGINKGPTVLSDTDFDTYVKQTGAQVFYRGWSGNAAVDRFTQAQHNHVGNGVYGDGYYFTPDLKVAKSYAGSGGVVTKMALSPSARVVSYDDVSDNMSSMSPKLRAALGKTGRGGSGRTFGTNRGEAQAALKMGYNVVDMGTGYLYGVTADAFVTSTKRIKA